MRIEEKCSPTVNFSEIELAEVFTYDEEFYMKIVHDFREEFDYNAVHLSDGNLVVFESRDRVIRCNNARLCVDS